METDLRRASLEVLEAIYVKERPLVMPRGSFEGRVLARLQSSGARRWSHRALQVPSFEWVRFGIDFDDRRWWFVRPSWLVGRFEMHVGRSRWRDTQAIALEYEASHLPRLIKRVLYDEVKPLRDELLLGLGGTNAGPGEGDHFFFELRRITRRVEAGAPRFARA